MKYVLTAMIAFVAVALVATPATADWTRGDPYKMHYPQMPDPNGWDVNISFGSIVADDWECTESGPVNDVHFWASWRHDDIGEVRAVHVGIWDNDPGMANGFSHPREPLWEHSFQEGEFVVDVYDTGQQGWYDPPEVVIPSDHPTIFQVNITNIEDIVEPFHQKEGEIYWLELAVEVAGTGNEMFGWKTSLDHFMDAAVWTPLDGAWEPLSDPAGTGEPLDMAFVITPEPGTVVMLLGAGLIGLLAYVRRWRKR